MLPRTVSARYSCWLGPTAEYPWRDAARLQEEALRLARTRAREATVRHQIEHRLFDEARYRDAAAEFEWARDLFRSSGRSEAQIRGISSGPDPGP